MRSVSECANCQELREITSHGLCQKCLMKQRRAREKANEPSWAVCPDRSQSRQQKELNKMRTNCSRMLELLDGTRISTYVLPDENYREIKRMLITAIDRIDQMQWPGLTVNSETSELTVNSLEPEPEPTH